MPLMIETASALAARLRLDRPLAFFDLETTGKYPERDRIVEISILTIEPTGETRRFYSLVNPGFPIPAEASAIHGISTEMVKAAPSFASLAIDVAAEFGNSSLGGYNVLRFDIPLLLAEFKRAGQVFSIDGRRVLDPQVLFFKREPRDLGAALKFFCGLELDGAHRAGADVDASIAVLLGQLERYPDLPASVEDLHALCSQREPSWIDAHGKLVWVQGEACLNFGKNAGKSLRQLAAHDANFLGWMLRNDFSDEVKAIVSRALNGRFPQAPGAAA